MVEVSAEKALSVVSSEQMVVDLDEQLLPHRILLFIFIWTLTRTLGFGFGLWMVFCFSKPLFSFNPLLLIIIFAYFRTGEGSSSVVCTPLDLANFAAEQSSSVLRFTSSLGMLWWI